MTVLRCLLVALLLVRPGVALAEAEPDPDVLAAFTKLELWRAATVFRAERNKAAAEARGLRAQLEARTSTTAAQVLVAEALPGPLEGPESARLGDQGPGTVWVLGGAAAFLGGLVLGLALGLSAGQ